MDESLTPLDLIPTGPQDQLSRLLLNLIADDSRIGHRVPVDTPRGQLVIGFTVEADGRRVGFEADARDECSQKRGDARDAAILASGLVDAMVHIREFDVLWYPHDALYLISLVEPAVFSPRGRLILERQAHPDVRRAIVAPGDERLSVVIWHREDDDNLSSHDGSDGSGASYRLNVIRHRKDGRLRRRIARPIPWTENRE